MPDPNQNNSNSPTQGNAPTIPSFSDAPPLPPDFQNIPVDPQTVPNTSDQPSLVPPVVLPPTQQPSPTTSVNDTSTPLGGSGSAAPSDLPPVITPPKKKFGGGRVIATILGLFLLVGGIGAGIVLTSQQQLFEQKASGVTYCTPTDAIMGYCTPPPGGGRGCLDTGCNTGYICHCQGGVGCSYGVCVIDTNFHTACEGDGREVCGNPNNPQAVTCCSAGYVCGSGGTGCVPGGGGSHPPGSGTPNPTDNPPTASCQSVKAYSSSWTLLTANELSHLARGTAINFCVTGTTSAGSFDKARFTINGAGPTETTTKRPSSNDYCTAYTIPATGTTFNITADIHHVSLGWK